MHVERQPEKPAPQRRLGLGLDRGGRELCGLGLGLRPRLGGRSTGVGGDRRRSCIPALPGFPPGGRAHGCSVRSRSLLPTRSPGRNRPSSRTPGRISPVAKGYVRAGRSANWRCQSFHHHTHLSTDRAPRCRHSIEGCRRAPAATGDRAFRPARAGRRQRRRRLQRQARPDRARRQRPRAGDRLGAAGLLAGLAAALLRVRRSPASTRRSERLGRLLGQGTGTEGDRVEVVCLSLFEQGDSLIEQAARPRRRARRRAPRTPPRGGGSSSPRARAPAQAWWCARRARRASLGRHGGGSCRQSPRSRRSRGAPEGCPASDAAVRSLISLTRPPRPVRGSKTESSPSTRRE